MALVASACRFVCRERVVGGGDEWMTNAFVSISLAYTLNKNMLNKQAVSLLTGLHWIVLIE